MNRIVPAFSNLATCGLLIFAPHALFVACAGDRPPDAASVYTELVNEFHLAEVRVETEAIDLGEPSARPYLVAGWSFDETGLYDEKTSFVWSEGPSSSLDFFLATPRSVEVSIRCAPFQYPGAPIQEIDVSANGDFVRRLRLRAAPEIYTFTLSPRSLAAGINRLDLKYRYQTAPRDVGPSPDSRLLAVAYDYIHFRPEGGVLADRPFVDKERRTLHLPFGAQVDFYLRLQPRSLLGFEQMTLENVRAGGVSILFQRRGERERTLANVHQSESSARFELPEGVSDIARISFRALPSRGRRPPAGGVVLAGPVLRGPKEAIPHEASQASASADRRRRIARPHIVIYLIDALRADHLGCYGYTKSVSPCIDEFAEDTVLFENAQAQSSWTRPSVASVLTGLAPVIHGANERHQGLSSEAVTLAEILAGNGYDTAAFITNANVDAPFGFDQGFDSFEYLSPPNKKTGSRASTDVNDVVLGWLRDRETTGRPFFLYIHTTDPHSPYTASLKGRTAPILHGVEMGSIPWMKLLNESRIPVDRALVDSMLSMYDDEIRLNDASFGRLMTELKRLGLYDDSFIILLSDHGEEFYERGMWEHGKTLHGEVVAIPMLVKPPGSSRETASRVTRLAQHIDVVPTLLDYLNLSVLEHLPGRSLLKSAPSGTVSLSAFSHLELDGIYNDSIVWGDWKLIRLNPFGSGPPWLALYDRKRDPEERANIATEHPVLAGYLHACMKRHWSEQRDRLRPTDVILDEETRRRLEALGYIR